MQQHVCQALRGTVALKDSTVVVVTQQDEHGKENMFNDHDFEFPLSTNCHIHRDCPATAYSVGYSLNY